MANKHSTSVTSAAPQPQSKQEYLQDITTRIAAARAGDKIALMTMLYDPTNAAIARLTDSLCTAAKKGADVLFIIDAHNFLRTTYGKLATPGRLFWSRDFAEHHHANDPILKGLQRITKAGGRTAIINKPSRRFTNPFGGRSHIKLTLINDRIYIGGCNLQEASDIDIMVNWTEVNTAKYLRELTEHIYQSLDTNDVFQANDISKLINDQSMLLIDAGVARQSIIYDEALQLIDEAKKSVFITCQYFPNSTTTKHLAAAQERGVEVAIIYNNPDKDYAPFNHIHRAIQDLERMRHPANFFSRELPKRMPYLHAKIIATEAAAIVGSHNYLRAGVNLGTAEIALLRRDSTFSQSLIDNIETQLKKLQ